MKQLSDLFKSLSDPTRRTILQLLRDGPKTPSDLLEEIDISQPTLSHHLDILKRSALIIGERNGQFIRYTLNMTVFDMAVEYLMQIQKSKG
jgi:DNA-binding transcriptional ArsR family regulator